MNLRQKRGIKLAGNRTIRKAGNLWLVPSQSGDGTRYKVDLAAGTCSCPDYELNREKCKHIFAAQVASGKHNAKPVVEITTMATPKTYRQIWSAYNGAQITEKDKFQMLLHELCAGLPAEQPRRGRPSVPASDAVFAATFKVYSTLSGRRFMSDLREAHERGWISRVPCFNTIFHTLQNDDLSEDLQDLVQRSAVPLQLVETEFAADSTGFSTSRKAHWADTKRNKVGKQRDWVKCHVMCGVKTQIVTAIEIKEQTSADVRNFEPLLDTTVENFDVVEVSADKGYSSRRVLEQIDAVGATPYVMFTKSARGLGGGIWEKMYGIFMFQRKKFTDHYHQRSKIESAFSSIKRKFGNFVRSRKETAMKNEILCKFLCHNLVVLIHEMHELGIDPVFWGDGNGNKRPHLGYTGTL